MKRLEWSSEKNKTLLKQRGITFLEVTIQIINGKVIEIVKHPNSTKYPNQYIYIINIKNYIYLVPFVEDDEKIFLKTIIPSRKATKNYLKTKNEKDKTKS